LTSKPEYDIIITERNKQRKKKEKRKMTVKELIEKLKELPQDADVYRYNVDCSHYYLQETEEMICSIICEDNYSVTIR